MTLRRVNISEIATFINGFPFKPSDWENEGYPIIRIQNLSDPKKPYNRTSKLLPPKYLVQSGDILVSWSATIDVFEWNDEPAYLNQHIFKVEFDNTKVNKDYFKIALKHSIGSLIKFAHGSTMKHVVKGDFDAHKIALPPLKDQILIAEILTKAEALIAKRKKSMKALDELLKSTFLEMFGDPVRNTKRWELKRIDEFSDTRLGKMRDKQFITGNYLKYYLGNSNVRWFSFDLNSLDQMDFNEEEQEKFSLEYGDLLVCEGGEIGRCAIWKSEKQDVYFQKAIHRIRVEETIIKQEYLQYVFYWYATGNGFKNVNSKATISHLTGEKLKETKIPIPPLSLQIQFSEKVAKLESIKNYYQMSLSDLENLYTSLSQRAFTTSF